ncbi:MAG: helix-turn-helix domain-containing protein [Bacteroidota bacterium]
MVTNYQYSFPKSNLRPYIRFFWVAEGLATENKPYIHSRFPGGFCDLLFVYKGSFIDIETGVEFKEGDIIVGGPKDVLTRYLVKENFGTFAICLYPYVLPILTSFSGESLLNQVLESSYFNNLHVLEDRLRLTKTNQERIQVSSETLNQILIKRDTHDDWFLSMVRSFYKQVNLGFNELLENSNVSLRHFQRKFKDYTGFTPKKLQRIIRLHSAVRGVAPQNLTKLALDSGFYDQAHFINDFKKVSGGLTPRDYFKRQDELRWRRLGANVAFFQFDK